MTFIRKGWGFHVGQDFARATRDTPIELAPDEYAERGSVIGYIEGDPKHSLGFMRHKRVRVHVQRQALIEKNPARRRAKSRRHSERGFFPKLSPELRAAFVRRNVNARIKAARQRKGLRDFPINLKPTKAEMRDVVSRLTRRRNPAGVRIIYNKLLGGWYVVRGPHQTPLNGRFNSKAEARAWLAGGPARRNPATHIKRSRAMNSEGAKAIAHLKRNQRRSHGLDKEAPFHTQVKRGERWITLGRFSFKASATDYGRALKHKYPSKSFRVFW